MAKFTFKTEKQTGKYKAFYTPHHHVKLDKFQVGTIDHSSFKIRLMVYDDALIGTNCEWKWITLKYTPISIADAKQFLLERQDSILNKYRLHKLES